MDGSISLRGNTTWYIAPREDSLQFFREERVDGAVYNVFFKKVRYHRPSDEGGEDSIQNATLQWKTETIRQLKAGSLERIIESVAFPDGEMDSSHLNIFLSTFRSFASITETLDAIFKRYKDVSANVTMKTHVKEAHLKSLKSVIFVWLDSYRDDFNKPPEFQNLRKLHDFALKHIPDSDLAHRAKIKLSGFSKEDSEGDSSEKDSDDSSEDNKRISTPASPGTVDDLQSRLRFTTLDDNISFMMTTDKVPANFMDLPEDHFAEQLTFIDSELFRKVIPHHCLGSVWAHRDKKGMNAPSVYATVNQFNAVSYRVIATVLKIVNLSAAARAKVIEKWLDIAQELRILKNFSSLKAIISGLQSNPVYRLRQVWFAVSRDSVEIFEELAELFSEQDNQMMIREMLVKEGTAKYADLDSDSTFTLRRREGRKSQTPKRKSLFENQMLVPQGTVPYLGTFLSDLTMLDTAIPDKTEEGLINIEKKRKEFEILAQIRLLQSAARMYRIKSDAPFQAWFHSLRVYDDKESYELSCEIEPVTPSTPREVKGHRKKSSLGFFSPRKPPDPDTYSAYSAASVTSAGIYDETMSVASAPDLLSPPRPPLKHSISASSLGSIDSISIAQIRSQDKMYIKVVLQTMDSDRTNHYKCISITNSDHTTNVLRNIFLKFHVDARPQDYCLFQILPDGELQIPDKGNVFYAINTSLPELKFIVRKKSDLERLKKARHKKKKKRLLFF